MSATRRTKAVSTPIEEDETLFTPETLATYLTVPVRTIYHWNYTRTGPKVIKLGQHCRYRRRDVEAWLDRRVSA